MYVYTCSYLIWMPTWKDPALVLSFRMRYMVQLQTHVESAHVSKSMHKAAIRMC